MGTDFVTWTGIVIVVGLCMTCVSSEELLMSTPTSIQKIDVNSGTQTAVVTKNNGRLLGIAAHIKNKQLFWSDVSSNGMGIYVANLDGTNQRRIVSYEDMNPVGLAVDWIFDHLYWTDTNYKSVMMSNLDGSGRVTISTQGLVIPRGIAVDPYTRTLFIGDQGAHTVTKCDLDGSNCKVIESANLDLMFWPNQLTVDQNSRRVYWTEGWVPSIMSCAMDATDCRKDQGSLTSVVQTNPLFGISIGIGNTTYLTALNNQSVYSFHSNGSVRVVSQTMDDQAFFLLSTDQANQPYRITSHSCISNKGGCSDICLPQKDGTAKCACTANSGKLPQNNKCVVPSEFILFTDFNGGRVGMADPLLNGIETTIVRAENPVAVTYDPVEEDIYFSDAALRAIYRCKIDGSNLQEFLNSSHGIGQVEGLAIDFKQRRLYFSNPGYVERNGVIQPWHVIEMIDLSGKNERYSVVTGVEKPRALAIDSDARMLYYTDWGDFNPHVGRVRLDGTGRENLFTAENPNGLTIIGNKLYAVDSKYKSNGPATLYVQDLDSDSMANFQLTKTREYAFSITAKGSYLFVSGLNGGINMYSSANADYQRGYEKSMYTNIYFTVKKQNIASDDGVCQNVKCSDICVTTPDPTYATCLCPTNKLNYMEDDRQTCSVPSQYLLFADLDGIKMIPQGPYKDRTVYTLIPTSPSCDSFSGLTGNGTHIFFSSGNSIYRAGMDGTQKILIFQSFNGTINSLAIDVNNNLFWTSVTAENTSTGVILQQDLKDENATPQTLLTGLRDPSRITVTERAVYWTELGSATEIFSYDRVSKARSTVDLGQPQDAANRDLDNLGSTLFISNGKEMISRIFPLKNYRPINAIMPQDPISFDTAYRMQNSFTLSDFQAAYIATTEKSVFISDQNSTILKYNMLSQMTEVVATKMAHPGQMYLVNIDRGRNSDKPGQCPSSVNCSSTVVCTEDYNCLGKQKCCATGQCTTCADPVVGTVCNVDGYVLQNGGPPQRAGCKVCSCIDGVVSCTALQCPDLGNCPNNSKVKLAGDCCNTCLVTKACTEKPQILNCPTDPVTLLLPEDSDTVIFNKYNFRNIQAKSCSGQSLALVFSKTSLRWAYEPQTVTVMAKDSQGKAECDLQILVKDVTPPVITSCEGNQIIRYSKSTQTEVSVTWQPVTATDNSGIEPIIVADYSNGGAFSSDSTLVTYAVSDAQGNPSTTTCSFTVKLMNQDSECDVPPSLHNGFLNCTLINGVVMRCYVQSCNQGYIRSSLDVYSCSSEGKWTPPFPGDFASESCRKPEPSLIGAGFSANITCTDPSNQDTAQKIQDSLNKVRVGAVDWSNFKVSVTGGTVTSGNKDTLSVMVEGLVPGETNTGVRNEKLQKMSTDIEKLRSSLMTFLSDGGFDQFCPVACSFNSFIPGEIQNLCQAGSTEVTVVGGKICAMCPVGTEFYTSSDQNGKPTTSCRKCAPGQYQNLPGQAKCKNCPHGSNSPYGAIDVSQCVATLVSDTRVNEMSSSRSYIIVGVIIAVVVLVIVVAGVVVLFFRRRQQYETNKPGIVNQAFNPSAPLDFEEYDHIPADMVMSDEQLLEQKAQASNENPYECSLSPPARDSHGYGVIGNTSERCSNDYTTLGESRIESHGYTTPVVRFSK